MRHFNITLLILISIMLTACGEGFLLDPRRQSEQSSDASECTTKAKDFGALGDGMADDSAAIRSALNAIPEAGGTLCLQQGLYLVSQDGVHPWALVVRSNLRIIGSEPGAIIRLKPNSDRWVRVFSTDLNSTVTNVEFKGFEIDGNNEANQSEQQHGIFLSGTSDSRILQMKIYNTGGDAVYFHHGNAGPSIRNHVFKNEFYGLLRVGVNFDGAIESLAEENFIHDTQNWAMKMEADAGGLEKSGNTFLRNTALRVEYQGAFRFRVRVRDTRIFELREITSK
jgi:polygalacturonase